MIAAQLVACRSGIGPKDELEGMMAAQLIAAHNAAMECYRRAMISEQSFEGRREALNQANKHIENAPRMRGFEACGGQYARFRAVFNTTGPRMINAQPGKNLLRPALTGTCPPLDHHVILA
jgi:hypothetical protein